MATRELGRRGWGGGGGLRWESSGHPRFPRLSGKEEALCRLQEENRRLSLEQERVSMADGGWTDRRAAGQKWGAGGGDGPSCQGPRAGGLPSLVAPTAGRRAMVGRLGWTRMGLEGAGTPGD